MWKRLGIFLIALFLAAPARAQQAPARVVEDVMQAYRQLDYDEAERTARAALESYGDFTVAQLTDVHTILGLVAYGRGSTDEARRHFVSALELTPDLELDPLLVPPRILSFFDDVKAARGTPDVAGSDARYVLVPDVRPAAALRSMIVPGWGQLYKGESAKGWALAGTWGLAMGGAVLAHVKRADARDAYETAVDPDEIPELYDRYNRWHRMRGGLVQGAAAVWVVSYVDALLSRGSVASGVRPTVSPVSVGVHVQF